MINFKGFIVDPTKVVGVSPIFKETHWSDGDDPYPVYTDYFEIYLTGNTIKIYGGLTERDDFFNSWNKEKCDTRKASPMSNASFMDY